MKGLKKSRQMASRIEPVTLNLGVIRCGGGWHVVDLDTEGQIGGVYRTKLTACAYALHRQETTYS